MVLSVIKLERSGWCWNVTLVDNKDRNHFLALGEYMYAACKAV